MTKLTLGTAKIINLRDGRIVVKWMGATSVHDNETYFNFPGAAAAFCCERGLRVIGQ